MKALANKNIVVTGGSRGIGRAIVAACLAAGGQVLTCGRSPEPDHLPAGTQWFAVDLGQRDGAGLLAAHARTVFDRADVLVNNAGIQLEKTLPHSTDADYDQLMNINVRGVFGCCRAFLPAMIADGGGCIVNIGSVSAAVADPGLALYNASKAFVVALGRSIAVDHGAQGIRCNTISPGWIDTGMAEAAFDLAKDPVAARRDALARHPAGRLGRPEDIAETVVWLASDRAAFVTGQNFTVDGGLMAATPIRTDLL